MSVNCPLTPETHHLIDRGALATMKPGAYLVNTGRGGVVATDALVEALRSGHLAGAALDVMEDEPPVPDSPLLGLSHGRLRIAQRRPTRSKRRRECTCWRSRTWPALGVTLDSP